MNARVGIDIVASDKTAKGAASAEKRLSGVTKKMAKGAGRDMGVAQRGVSSWGRGIIRTFNGVESAATRAFSGPLGSGGSGIISRLGAMRTMASLAGGSMGEAAAGAGLLEAGIVGIGGAAVATGAAVAALAVTMVKLADGWGKGAAQLGNMASLIGVSTKGLQEFTGAAERVGVDKNTATGALGGLSQTLNDARYGRNNGAVALLARMGVKMKLKEDGTADTEAMLPDIAEAITRQNSSGRRTALRGLGISEGAAAVFTQGRAALTGDMADYGKNGAVVTDDDVKLGRQITHRDTVATQWAEKGALALQRGNGQIVKGAGDMAIDAYNGMTKPSGQAADPPSGGNGSYTMSGKPRNGRILNLSRHDVEDLKKVVETEWDKRSIDQGHGVIDTVLNRTKSGRWGNSVHEVANARSQFSDINGPIAWRKGRHSVDQVPASRVTAKTNRLVDEWLAKRAGGAASSVSDNLNYANPNYSDRRNLRWINRLDGPQYGRGDSIHRHGTTRELERYRPGEFGVGIPIDVRVTVDEKRSKATVTTHVGRGGKPAVSQAFGAPRG